MPVGQLEAGRAFVDIVPKLNKGAAAATQAQMGGVFGKLSTGAKTAGLAVGAGLLAGGAIAAVGLAKIGTSFDSAFRTIRLGTGATGDALEGLKDSFKTVTSNVPDDLGNVATAIADLNTRTGQTGPELERLSTQILNLARVADEDLGETIEAQTRLFGDWGVAVGDQAGTLDFLFKTSQATGIGVNDLSRKLVQFGGPLRQLGFSMETSAALLGKFEKEGVNTELVLGSLRIALGKMARDGEDSEETLARVTDQIKNAGSASEANALALELFGARAGPDMAAAIREGRFEVDDLLGSIEGSPETINGAARDVETLGEKFGRLRNKVLVGLEPLATGFLGFLEDDLFPALEPVIEALAEKLPGAFAAIAEAVGPVLATIAELAEGFALFWTAFTTGFTQDEGGTWFEDLALILNDKLLPILEQVGAFLSENMKPILIGLGAAFAVLVAPVASVIAALVIAYTRFEGFRNVVDAVVGFLLREVVPRVVQFATYVAEQFGNLVGWVQEHWGAIQEAIGHVVAVIEGIVTAFVDAVLLVWEYFGDTILVVIESAWENVRAIVELAIDIIAGLIEAGLAIINGDWGEAWDAIVGILSSIWDTIGTIIGNAIEIVKTLLGDGFDAAKDLVGAAVDGIVDFFTELPGRLARAAGDVFGFLWEAFRAAVNLIIDGWNALEFKIPGFDPPGPGPKFGGFTLGVPDIPRLRDGGDILRAGLSIVGEGQMGGELVSLPAGATATPLDTAAMIAEAALAGADGGPRVNIERLIAENPIDATADETVDAINAKLGWKLTTRKDR